MNARDMLLGWLSSRLEPSAQAWLCERCVELSTGGPDKRLFLAFGQAVRRTGKSPLALDPAEQAQAFALHPGWNLCDWTVDQAARAALLLSLPSGPKTIEAILALHQTADMGEHVALVRPLFLLPDAMGLLHIAREGMRSNMRNVFEAVSQRNPNPADFCDDIAWNQMVVKCVFQELPLHPIYGLDRRANAELSRILLSLVEERRAAHRAISSEVWRCIHPFIPLAR
jgi:hypothetical protein